MGKYRCPCCGYFTYNVPANEDCGYICPVCFWENEMCIRDRYEDNVNGKISDERFMELSADYEQEQRELKDRAARCV